MEAYWEPETPAGCVEVAAATNIVYSAGDGFSQLEASTCPVLRSPDARHRLAAPGKNLLEAGEVGLTPQVKWV
jgi:hypothetical protein